MIFVLDLKRFYVYFVFVCPILKSRWFAKINTSSWFSTAILEGHNYPQIRRIIFVFKSYIFIGILQKLRL
jgi:hypothetical protein